MFPKTFSTLVAGLCVFGAASVAGPAVAQAADAAKVMLVLDASGSMWGKVDGAPKIEIARRTIRELLKNWDKKIELGLTVYGHRSKGDCNDIQTLLPVGPANPAAIAAAVDGLTPKGKTPLTAAVRRAAQQLKFTESKATVILVSDGKETCEADPCAAAKELKKLGVDFRVHVVGFDIRKDEQAGLKCLADNTGGLYLSADNATQLNAALKTAVVEVKKETRTVAAPRKPEPALKPGHHFTALLAPGGPVAADSMRWDIFEAATNLEGKRKHVTGTYDARPLFKLNPGQYIVIAKYGVATVQKTFEVKSAGDAVKHELVLNAGLLGGKAMYAKDSEVIKSGLRWDLYGLDKNLEGKQKHYTGTYDSNPVFRMPAGRYQLIVKRGSAVVTMTVEVAAGKRSDLTVDLNAGLFSPSAVLTEGAKALGKGMRWDIYGLEKNLDGKRKHYTGTYDAKPLFTLTAGRYQLVVKNGSAVKTTEFEVKAGKRTDPEIDLNAGQVKLVGMTKDGKTVDKGTRWDIYGLEKNLDGKRAHITGTYDATPIFTLPAGKFHLVLKFGNVTHEGELEVKAGDSKQVDVKVQ